MKRLLLGPPTKCKTFGDHSLRVSGHSLWQKLSEGIKAISSLKQFKHKLNTYEIKRLSICNSLLFYKLSVLCDILLFCRLSILYDIFSMFILCNAHDLCGPVNTTILVLYYYVCDMYSNITAIEYFNTF